MRKLIFSLILVFGSAAQAADFSYLPLQTEEQKDLKDALIKSNWSKALGLWPKAFSGSGFATTDTGRALRIYLIAQNDMPATATKLLVRETEYGKLNGGIRELWQPLIDTYISEIPQGMMNASWKRHFFSQTVIVKNAKDLAIAFKRAQAESIDNRKAKILWTIATTAPQFSDTKSALKALEILRTLKQSAYGADQIELATARILYQMNKLDEAIQRYSLVSKSSDLWLEAIEERAWAHLRKKDHDKAVSDITTVIAPVFAPITGPEAYFLSELTALHICDYPTILRTSKIFKERHKERLAELGKLSATGTNKAVDQVLKDIANKGLSIQAVGANVRWMPKNFLRDSEFAKAVKFQISFTRESGKAKDVIETLNGDPELERVLAEGQADLAQTKATMRSRLKKLAAEDIAEYRVIINKLHIVEAEVIERLHIDESLQGKRNDLAKNSDPRNTLSFPYTEEVWMDELDHYKAAVKNCPSLPATKGASL